MADDEHENGAGMSVELVVEIRDHQRNEFAQATFSKAIEEVLVTNGDNLEAEWCLFATGTGQLMMQVFLFTSE